MPTRAPEPRRVRSARRRAAFHAHRERVAATPAQRMKAAVDRMLSAAAHGKDRPARALAGEVADQARAVSDRAGMPQTSRDRNEHLLATAAAGRARLGVALRWLSAAVAHLPHDERDPAYTHYAGQLADEARRLSPGGG